MADSLDDFFAKKDKSKKKGKTSKTKFVAADLLPPQEPEAEVQQKETKESDDLTEQVSDLKLEADSVAPQKDKKKSKKKRDKEEESRKNEDDEWVAIDREKDYTGLRIGTKTVVKEQEEEGEPSDDSEVEYDEHGQKKQNEKGGVWRKVTNTASSQQEEQEEDTPPPPHPPAEPQPTELPNVSGGKYIPPSKRGTAASSDGSSMEKVSIKKPGGYRKKQAPNITSQDDFPTLGSAPPPLDPDAASFERVRGRGSNQQQAPSRSSNQRVETANMYSVLQ